MGLLNSATTATASEPLSAAVIRNGVATWPRSAVPSCNASISFSPPPGIGTVTKFNPSRRKYPSRSATRIGSAKMLRSAEKAWP
jgi:hypothetical protein